MKFVLLLTTILIGWMPIVHRIQVAIPKKNLIDKEVVQVDKPDFRNLKWGMSIKDVLSAETAPVSNSEKSFLGVTGDKTYYDGDELVYKGVTVGGKRADLYYHFENGKLIEIRIIFRHDLYTNYTGTMTDVVSGFKNIFNDLWGKGFRCTIPIQCGKDAEMGPDWDNPLNVKIRKMNTQNINIEELKLIEEMITENYYPEAFLRFENNRSQGFIAFATQYSELQKVSPIRMILTPSFAVKSQIDKSDF